MKLKQMEKDAIETEKELRHRIDEKFREALDT